MSVIETLDSIGFDYDLRGDEAVAKCPGHVARTGHEDGNPSWSINVRTGVHFCFSCGYRGMLERLVADVLGVSFEEARQHIRSEDISVDAVVRKARKKRVRRVLSIVSEADPAEYLSYDEVPEEMAASRGLTTETCRRFGIRSRGDVWILPIHQDGVMVGWQEKGPKGVFNRPTGVQKSKTLFGYADDIGDSVVVVESPLDAALCSQYGHAAVATFGASVSDYQIRILCRHYPILAFDNDAAGNKATESVGHRLSSFGAPYRIVEYPEGIKDFGDLPDPAVQIPSIVESSVWFWKRSLSRA